MIKRLIRTIGGAGGPVVQTELTVAQAQPGGVFEGIVEVTGGPHRVQVGYIALVLCAKVHGSYVDFHRVDAVPTFTLNPSVRHTFGVTCEIPWEAPLSLDGTEIGLRTELEISFAVDRSDLDPVHVSPLPAQQHILDCMEAMGFTKVSSNLEKGVLQGVPQSMPFYQEIKYLPGPAHERQLHNLQVTFVNSQDRLHVVVELDRRVTPLADRDVFGHFAVNPANLDKYDWPALLESWLAGLA
ncbi:MAG TPA: sporulation protein [Candidatus Limnocylindrales bacterium]